MVDRAVEAAPGPAGGRRSPRASPNGFAAAGFEAGADDVDRASAGRRTTMRFALEKAIARGTAPARAAARRPGAADLRARPEGRHGQDADVAANLAVALAERGHERRARRPRPPVRRRRALHSGCRPSRRSTTSCGRRLARRTRSSSDFLIDALVGRQGAARARRRPDQASVGLGRVPARASTRRCARCSTSSSSTRRPASRPR